MLNSQTLVTPKATVLFSAVGDEGVLYDEESGTYFGLNSVAARVWHLVSQGCRLGDVRSTVLDEFDVTPDQLDTDLNALLQDLVGKGLCVTQPVVSSGE